MSAARSASASHTLGKLELQLEDEEEIEDIIKNGRNSEGTSPMARSVFRTKYTIEPMAGLTTEEGLRKSVISGEVAMKRFKEAGAASKDATQATTLQRYLARGPEQKNSLQWVQWKTAVLIESQSARIFIMVLVLINGLLIGLEADLIPPNEINPTFQILEMICVAIFTVEMSLKMFGVGFKNFAYDRWNVVDALIVAASLADILLTETMGLALPSLSAIRLVRVLRVVRIVGMLERLATLAKAFLVAMEETMWVVALVVLVVYIFGIMGQGLFGGDLQVELYADQAICQTTPCKIPGIPCENRYSCFSDEFFRSVERSMITLFQIMTLDDWAKISRPIGCTFPWAWSFFTCFVLLGSMGLMNLITAVFIEALLEQTGLAAARKAEVSRRRAEKKVLIVEDTIRGFLGDDDGRLLNAPKLTAILSAIEGYPYLVQAFEDVGAPLASLRSWMHFTEEDEQGGVDIPQLLTMVQTANLPTLRRTIFELKYRVYQRETREDKEIVVLSKMVDQLTTKLGGLNGKVDALVAPASSPSTGW